MQVLFESKPQSREQISHYMTFLSLLTLHKQLIKSFKTESDSVIKGSKLNIPGHYKGLIYRLIFLKTLYLTQQSHISKENLGIIGTLKQFAVFLYKLSGGKTSYSSSYSEQGQYNGSNWPHICPTIWNKFGIDPFGPYRKFTTDKNLVQKWKNWQINEFHDRDIFQSKDRLNIAYNMISQACDIFNLMPNGEF